MIDALFNSPNYVAAKKLLDVTVMRHKAIATNLENLETPNYKRIDVSSGFAEELKRAVSSQSPGQIASLQPMLEVDRQAIARNRDGNTVQLESEMMRLSQNSMEHALETQLVTGALMRMRMAITGRSS